MPRVDRRHDCRVMHRIGALGHLQLAGEDRAGLAQPGGHGAVDTRAPVAERDRAHMRGCVLGRAEVLEAEGDAVERALDGAARDLLVRLCRLPGRDIRHHRGVAAERAISPFDPRERVRRHLGGGDLPRLNLRRDLGQHQLVQVRHPNLRPQWWAPIERQSRRPRKANLPACAGQAACHRHHDAWLHQLDDGIMAP